MQIKRMPFLQKNFSLLQNRSKPTNECLTTITSVKSCSAMVSAGNSYGQNTWKNAVQMANKPLMYSQFCYHIQQDDRNIVQQCISTANPANRSKLTGQRSCHDHRSRYRRDHQGIHICRCNDIQPVCVCRSLFGYEATILDQCTCPYV